MKDFKITLTTIILSIIANLLTVPIQKFFETKGSFDISIISYWYIFVFIIILSFIFELFKILLDENKSRLFRSYYEKIIFNITKNKIHEKKYIVNNINGRINLARKKFDYSNELLPKLVKVEFIDDEKENMQTYDLNDGEFVVKLLKSDSQEKNIVDIAHAVCKKTSLNGVRYIISKNNDLEIAIDEVIVEKILKNINKKTIIDFYYKNCIEQHLENTRFCEYYKNLKTLDNKGTFSRIFLTEINDFSKKLYGIDIKPYLLGELENLLFYLSNITPEKTKEGVDLVYEKAHIKIGILLIKKEKILQEGIEPYIKMINEGYFPKNINSFYIIYYYNYNIKFWSSIEYQITNLINEINNYSNIEKVYDETFNIIDEDEEIEKKTRCIRYIIHFQNT